jgi:hypothetical protein
MTFGKPIIGALLVVFVGLAFRNDLPSPYRALFSWLIMAVAVSVPCFYAGLALRESFQASYVYLLLAACIPLVMLTLMSAVIRIVEMKLNRPVVLLVKGGEDRYLSAALIAVLGLSAAAIGLLMRNAP